MDTPHIDDDKLTALRRDWISGMLSTRLMRIKHSLPDSVDLDALASLHKWGNRPTMHERIEDETARALVDRAVSAVTSRDRNVTGEPQLVDDDAQVAAYAQQVAGVVESQRAAAHKGRSLADSMLDELARIQPPQVDQDAIKSLAAAVAVHNPELAAHLREHVGPVSPAQQMTFLSRRIGMLRTVSEAHERYISLERQAWGLDNVKEQATDFDQVMTAIDARRVLPG